MTFVLLLLLLLNSHHASEYIWILLDFFSSISVRVWMCNSSVRACAFPATYKPLNFLWMRQIRMVNLITLFLGVGGT